MTREEVEDWKKILKENSLLGCSERLCETVLNPNKGQFCIELYIAKTIAVFLTNSIETALEIYTDMLTTENIQIEIDKVKSVSNTKVDPLELIEEIVNGCLVATQIYRKRREFSKAFVYINRGIQVLKDNPVDLTYTSIAELYYVKWRTLEDWGKCQELLSDIESMLTLPI